MKKNLELGVLCPPIDGGREVSADARTGSAWIVELQPQVQMWIAPWIGDPGRTCVEASAKTFKTRAAAKVALARARRYSPFKSARIYQPLNTSPTMTGQEGKR